MKEQTMAQFFRWLYWTVALVVTVAAIAGCTILPSGGVTQGLTPEQITALGKDPANVCVRVAYGPGMFSFARAMPGVDVTCNSDGLKTTAPATATSFGIPMVITPTFRIAPGTTQ